MGLLHTAYQQIEVHLLDDMVYQTNGGKPVWQ